MIVIDGSHGEGGGQLLRTALSLSCLHQMPFRMIDIRKGRKKPGLMPQHLAAVRAAQAVSSAEVVGDFKGSTDLSFIPRGIKGGSFSFDIGTAGSTSLVLQTLIPILAFGEATSTVLLKGGTHVPFSPSFHYLSEVFAPCLSLLGIGIDLTALSHGFYPRGGGMVRAKIYPAKQVNPLRLPNRGNVVRVSGCSAVANLPLSIAERQRNAALACLGDRLKVLGPAVQIETRSVTAPSEGTFVFLKMESEHSVAGFTALGARGKRAETVGMEAAMELMDFYSSCATVDQHLADQVVLYLSLCSKESEFVVSNVSQHLLTNLWVIEQFRRFRYQIDGVEGSVAMVRINPR